jgi:tetratricopeptide (TPR) repeat protein
MLRLGSLILTVLALTSPLSGARAGTEPPQGPAIRILVVKTEAEARAAVADLNAGTPFEQIVRERSTGPEREQGGYLGRVNPAGLSPQARAAIAKTPPGRVSPIFATENGFAIIQVLTTRQVEELETRLHREPEAQALLERGTEVAQAGDLEAAERLLRQAVELNPKLVDAHYNLAIVYRRQRKLDAAVAAIHEVIRLQPDDFEAHMRLGIWSFEGKKYPEACEAFERAATLRMDSRDAWLGLAQSYDAAGRARAAVGAYRQVIAIQDTADAGLLRAYLRVAKQAGDGPAAVAAARKLQPFQPGSEGFVTIGEALLLNGEAEAAVQEYEKAVALAPSSAAAQAGLASAYAKAGQAEAAVERYLRAIQLEPGNSTHYRTLARLYESQGRLDLAIVALRDGVSAATASSRDVQVEMVEELAALYDRAGMDREANQERLRAKALQRP